MSQFRTLAPGTPCGPYEIVREIGRGGTAIVYLAHGPDGAKVAIKIMQFAKSLQPDKMKRFRAEIEILGRILHINVVRFYDAGRVETGETGSLVWMAQEYVEGVTLREIVHSRGGRLPYDDVARWGAQIADGVAAAHALGVIHRDLKPENVILNTSDAIKVIDFNIAKFREWGVTTTGHKMEARGTLGYMAPEQIDSGFGAISERTDVHALGFILFELVTGRSALSPHGQELNVQETMARTVNAVPPRAESLKPGCPPELADIIEKALAKQPAERFESTAAISLALTDFARRFTEARVQAALSAMGDDEEPGDAERERAGWQPGQKRTVKMATPDEALRHPRAQAARVADLRPLASPEPPSATRVSPQPIAAHHQLDATVPDRPSASPSPAAPAVGVSAGQSDHASRAARQPSAREALSRSTGAGLTSPARAPLTGPFMGGLSMGWLARGTGAASGAVLGLLFLLAAPAIAGLFATPAPAAVGTPPAADRSSAPALPTVESSSATPPIPSARARPAAASASTHVVEPAAAPTVVSPTAPKAQPPWPRPTPKPAKPKSPWDGFDPFERPDHK